MILAVAVVVVVAAAGVFAWSLCRVAADADRRTEMLRRYWERTEP